MGSMFAAIWRKGWRRRLTLAAMLLVCTALPWLIATGSPQTVLTFFRPVGRFLSRILAILCSVVPFSLYEWVVVAAALLGLFLLVRLIVRLVRRDDKLHLLLNAMAGLLVTALSLACAFTWLWGLNYVAPPLAQTLGLHVETPDSVLLKRVTLDLAEKAAALAPQVTRAEHGVMVDRGLSIYGAQALRAYDVLAQTDDRYANATPSIKRVTGWWLMSSMGISGMYFPFTGECNVNPDCPASSLPFTACHEIAHRLGFAPENEANYIAYLASTHAPDVDTRYSGYLESMFYCYNKLSDDDRAEVCARLNDEVFADWGAQSAHYDKYNSKLREISTQINDSYLQAVGQPQGVQSYGMVVELIMADYIKYNRFGGAP